MLAYFPYLYDDELLYGWFARYHVHSTNISPKQTMQDLLLKKNAIAVADLPTNINKIYENISHFKDSKPLKWIKDHTLYRYYTAFSDEDVKNRVIQTMLLGTEPRSIHLLLGIMGSSIKDNNYFKYCPKLYSGRFSHKGEAYWRRNHQALGALFCLKHNEILLNASAKLEDTINMSM
ncbi:TniQ family protein [Anaerobacillus sp. HL2]|nr:TniQ family protein [Anaerobacillus sp. HL2]